MCYFRNNMENRKRILLVVFCLNASFANLLCDGSFEAYSLDLNYNTPTTGQTYTRKLFPNNVSCWYSNQTNFEINRVHSPPSLPTSTLSLTLTNPVKMCTSVSLNVGDPYILQYSVYTNDIFTSATVECSLNSVAILSITNPNYTVVTTNSALFKASQINNQVCFYEVAAPYTSPYGPQIDDISIVLSSTSQTNQTSNNTQEVVVNVVMSGDFWTDSITFLTDYAYYDDLKDQLEEEVRIFSDGKLLDPISIQKGSNGALIIVYDEYRTMQPEKISIEFPVLTINGTQTQFLFRISSMMRYHTWGILVKAFISFARTFVFSYYFFNLIGLCNLTLLYYFLLIGSLPNFAKLVFSRLCFIFFTQSFIENNFSILMQREFRLPAMSFLGEEKINIMAGDYEWFGIMGQTSSFLRTYVQLSTALILFLLKGLLLKGLNRLLPKKFRIEFIESKNFIFWIFVSEIVAETPFITISAVSVISNLSSLSWVSKLNSFLHVAGTMLALGIVFLCYIHCRIEISRVWQIKSSKSSSQLSKLKKEKKNIIFNIQETHERFSFYLMHFTIPLLVSIKQPITFFVFNGIVILWRARACWLHRNMIPMKEFFFRAAFNLVWIIHHLAFLFLFVVDEGLLRIGEQALDIVGYVCIFTVVGGASLEIIDLLIGFIEFLVEKIKSFGSRNKVSNSFMKEKTKKKILKKVEAKSNLNLSPEKKNEILCKRILSTFVGQKQSQEKPAKTKKIEQFKIEEDPANGQFMMIKIENCSESGDLPPEKLKKSRKGLTNKS